MINNLKNFVAGEQTCPQIANPISTKTGAPMGTRENPIHHRPSMPSLTDERRRFQRMHLQIPLFIRGKEAHGQQLRELAKTLDISGLGAFRTCPRALAVTEVVTLTVPAPSIAPS